MNKGLIATLAIFATLFILLGGAVSVWFGYNNSAVSYEVNIKKADESIGIIFSNFKQGLGEIVQVPTMMKEDTVDVFKAAIEGRYGPNGSGAMLQMIKEQNPTLDPQLYRKIQVFIEGKRNELVLANQRLIDERAYYDRALHSLPGKWLFSMQSFPTFDLATKYVPIQIAASKVMLQTGIEPDVTPLRSK